MAQGTAFLLPQRIAAILFIAILHIRLALPWMPDHEICILGPQDQGTISTDDEGLCSVGRPHIHTTMETEHVRALR